MSKLTPGAVPLSRYPSAKVIVSCEKCGMRVQYDKQSMLDAGGDRELTTLLTDIVKRNGCEKAEGHRLYDRCMALYANLIQSEYAKAKGG